MGTAAPENDEQTRVGLGFPMRHPGIDSRGEGASSQTQCHALTAGGTTAGQSDPSPAHEAGGSAGPQGSPALSFPGGLGSRDSGALVTRTPCPSALASPAVRGTRWTWNPSCSGDERGAQARQRGRGGFREE